MKCARTHSVFTQLDGFPSPRGLHSSRVQPLRPARLNATAPGGSSARRTPGGRGSGRLPRAGSCRRRSRHRRRSHHAATARRPPPPHEWPPASAAAESPPPTASRRRPPHRRSAATTGAASCPGDRRRTRTASAAARRPRTPARSTATTTHDEHDDDDRCPSVLTSFRSPEARSPVRPVSCRGMPAAPRPKADLSNSRASAQDGAHEPRDDRCSTAAWPPSAPRSSPRCRRWPCAPGRSTSARASPTPTAPRRCARPRSAALRDGRGNQYPPGPGIPELRTAIADAPAARLRPGLRPRHRGAGHRGRHRGHRRRAARPAGAGRRGHRPGAVLRLVRGLHRDGGRHPRPGHACARTTGRLPASTWTSCAPRSPPAPG